MIAILALIGAWFLGCFALLCAYGLGMEIARAWRRHRTRPYLRKIFNSTEWP